MNGDLSLSQSLGGLRIANPDDDGASSTSNTNNNNNPTSSSSPQPQTSSIHHSYSQTRRPVAQQYPQNPNLDGSRALRADDGVVKTNAEGVDVNSLGFNPTAYIPSQQQQQSHQQQQQLQQTPQQSQQYQQTPPYTQQATPLSHQSSMHRLNHRSSMPFSQDASQQQYYRPSPRTYNPPSIRPSSGLYNTPNMMSNPVHTPESTYSRVRSESTQSSNSAVRRSNSRSGAVNSINSMSNPAANGAPYRHHSQSNPPTSQQFPPRRSSKTRPSQQDDHPYHATTQPQSSSSLPSHGDAGPLATSAEEWQERGAAVGVKKVVDPAGKPTSRVVKKGVKDFAFGRTLGEGSYSTVMAATDRSTQKEYAIKILDKRHIIKEKKVKYVNIEKDTLNRLTEHPGIVRLYYTFQDERSLYFVLDLATGGELLGVLKKTSSFDEDCSRFYGAQILDAIEYMHTRGIIHRDLKPENVLLDDQGHVKITDFGTAKILDLTGKAQFGKVSVANDPLDGADTDRAVSFVGTAEYVSPELLTDKNACKASDLWAFGCIIYQLLAGRPPFKAANEYQTFQKIVNLEYGFPDGFPSIARDLVTRLLVLDPGQRMPIDEIKRHPFFTGIQWGKGLWKEKPPKLRAFNPATSLDAKAREAARDGPGTTAIPPTLKSSNSTGQPSGSTPPRPQPRLITELAPPSQLDIDWSPVLTKSNERIVKLGQLVVYSNPAPHSPITKGSAGDQLPEQPSKFSRFFGASVTKKRQRLVMVTSSARLVLAPAGGDKKEAKQIVELTDPEVTWRSQQDAKGYTVWCIFTRDKILTFEDPKANTGDSGSSMRSTKEWLDIIQEVCDYLPSRQQYTSDGIPALTPTLSNPSGTSDPESPRPDTGGAQGYKPKVLRKEPYHQQPDEESLKGRKRFSRRHSKNGLAAVF